MEAIHFLERIARHHLLAVWSSSVVVSFGLAAFSLALWLQARERAMPAPVNGAKPVSEAQSASEEPVALARLKVLPTAILLRDIERGCADAQLELLHFSLGDNRDLSGKGGLLPSTGAKLARQDFALTLRGEYAAVKRLLADLVERHVQLTVNGLRLEKPAQANTQGHAGVIQAQVSLVSWFAVD